MINKRDYRTIYLVARLNRLPRKYFNKKRLINTSYAMEHEIIKAFDANDGEIDAYHIDVWRHEYPELKYAE